MFLYVVYVGGMDAASFEETLRGASLTLGPWSFLLNLAGSVQRHFYCLGVSSITPEQSPVHVSVQSVEKDVMWDGSEAKSDKKHYVIDSLCVVRVKEKNVS